MIWGGKLCSAIYRLSPHLWGKTYKSFEHPVFVRRFQRQECHASCVKTTDVRMGNGTSGVKNQRGGMTRIMCFLPDHFLYRGVVRTVVHVLGRVGGRKTKDKSLDCKCEHFETVTVNLCGRHYRSWNSWQLGNWSHDKHVFLLTCLFSASAPMCPCRHDTILLCVLWDTTRTNSMRRSICAWDKMCNRF